MLWLKAPKLTFCPSVSLLSIRWVHGPKAARHESSLVRSRTKSLGPMDPSEQEASISCRPRRRSGTEPAGCRRGELGVQLLCESSQAKYRAGGAETGQTPLGAFSCPGKG